MSRKSNSFVLIDGLLTCRLVDILVLYLTSRITVQVMHTAHVLVCIILNQFVPFFINFRFSEALDINLPQNSEDHQSCISYSHSLFIEAIEESNTCINIWLLTHCITE